MSHAARGLWIVIACAGLGLAAPAEADQAAAQACAKGLPPEAMTIYQDSAPYVSAGTDMRSLLKTRVKALILAGSVQRAMAHGSAVAACGCLKDLK
jgi:predicted nicotinamide N-methyase